MMRNVETGHALSLPGDAIPGGLPDMLHAGWFRAWLHDCGRMPEGV
ncbi:MAG: hypothetical protein LBL33_07985 [Tannerella sp.]|nr:hypothetical protein [Tannerella sp.]